MMASSKEKPHITAGVIVKEEKPSTNNEEVTQNYMRQDVRAENNENGVNDDISADNLISEQPNSGQSQNTPKKEDQTQSQREILGYHQCEHPNCGQRFRTKVLMKNHMNRQHKKAEEEVKAKGRSVRCRQPWCGKLFKNMESLREHALIHVDRKPHKCRFIGCSEAFEEYKNLMEHMVINHSDTNPYKCKRIGCKFSFKKEIELLEHLKVHIDDKPYICSHDFCGESFSSYILLKIHVDEVHEVECEEEKPIVKIEERNVEKLVKCDQPDCEKSFETVHLYKIHLITHCDEKPYQCPRQGCPKKFKRKSSMDVHLRSFGRCKGKYLESDDKRYQCVHKGCDQAFQLKADLISHEKTTHPLFKCIYPDCDSNPFRRKDSYKRHLARHELGRQFICTFSKCSAAFYEKGALKEHLGTHSNKRFYCDFGNCKKSYTRNYQLDRHKKTHGDPLATDSVDHQIEGESSNDGKDVFFKQEIEDGFDFERVNHCSVCEKTFGDDNDFQNHTGSCGVSKFEFMEVDKIEIDDAAVPVKSESEN